MRKKIVVLGSLNIDLVTQVDHIPTPGETILGGDLQTVPGGKGANQAVAAARLGADVAMIGRVGQDGFAEQLLDSLKADSVDATGVLRDNTTTTGVALITVDAQGENSIVVVPGANGRLTPADVDSAETIIQSASHLLLQLETPIPTVLRAAQLAKQHAVTVILNPAPAQPLPAELLSLIDILIPNETEVAILTGMPTSTHAESKAAAAKLLDLGIDTIVMTLGSDGALLITQAATTHIPAFIPEKVVDTTAAGDGFIGGFATALAEGHTVTDAVRWGNAVGSLVVATLGAQPSLPTRTALNARLATS